MSKLLPYPDRNLLELVRHVLEPDDVVTVLGVAVQGLGRRDPLEQHRDEERVRH